MILSEITLIENHSPFIKTIELSNNVYEKACAYIISQLKFYYYSNIIVLNQVSNEILEINNHLNKKEYDLAFDILSKITDKIPGKTKVYWQLSVKQLVQDIPIELIYDKVSVFKESLSREDKKKLANSSNSSDILKELALDIRADYYGDVLNNINCPIEVLKSATELALAESNSVELYCIINNPNVSIALLYKIVISETSKQINKLATEQLEKRYDRFNS